MLRTSTATVPQRSKHNRPAALFSPHCTSAHIVTLLLCNLIMLTYIMNFLSCQRFAGQQFAGRVSFLIQLIV